MIRPEPNVIKALASLRVDARFGVVLDWLRESLTDQDRRNRALTSDQIARGQGVSLCLADIIGTCDEAMSAMKRLKQNGS